MILMADRRGWLGLILTLVLFFVTVVCACAAPEDSITATRTITDMAGRQVQIPLQVTRVLATSPPPLTFVYMLAPEKLIGWMPPGPAQGDTAYVPPEYLSLALIPRGLSSTTYEAYIAAQPDLVIYECEHEFERARIDQVQHQLGVIPVVAFSVNETRDMAGYREPIRFIGELLGVETRAEQLIAFDNAVRDEVIAKVGQLEPEQRTRTYYAEGANGLITDPVGSQHSQLIEVSGGINVADCPLANGPRRTPVTMESVLLWQPQVIIANDKNFMQRAVLDSSWQRIPAVRDKRVHLIPTRPFNWFDRPPGVNRIIGIPWTAHLLYPELFSRQWLTEKVREFYAQFYHYRLSAAELAVLVSD